MSGQRVRKGGERLGQMSVSIGDELKARLEERAGREGVPVSQLVSSAVKRYLDEPVPGAGKKNVRKGYAFSNISWSTSLKVRFVSWVSRQYLERFFST